MYNVIGVKRHIMPVDFPESESISGAEINRTVSAANSGVLCWNLAESKYVLKMCISKHRHERIFVVDCNVPYKLCSSAKNESKGFIFSCGI